MGQHAEAEFRIFVDDLALGRVVVEVGFDERVVREDFFHQGADFLAAGGTGFGFERGAAGDAELFDCLGHGVPPSDYRGWCEWASAMMLCK